MNIVESAGMRTRSRLAVVRAGVVALLAVSLSGCGTVTFSGTDAPVPTTATSAAPLATNADIQLVDGTASSNREAGDSGVTNQVGAQSQANWQQVGVAESGLGNGVVDVDGRTLYRFDEDSAQPPRSTCDGPCAATWPPVVVKPGGKLYVGSGVNPQQVGTVTRTDGGKQITIGGWPVYRFAGDHTAGDTNGQGVNGTWFAVTPEGKKLGVPAAPSAQPSRPARSAAPDGYGRKPTLTLVRTRSGSLVADGSGRTVYVTDRDESSPTQAKCTGYCLSGHDPVPAPENPSADIPGLRKGAVGAVRRPDGRVQLTLEGYPLYTSKNDGRSGDVKGQEGHWFALGLDGDK